MKRWDLVAEARNDILCASKIIKLHICSDRCYFRIQDQWTVYAQLIWTGRVACTHYQTGIEFEAVNLTLVLIIILIRCIHQQISSSMNLCSEVGFVITMIRYCSLKVLCVLICPFPYRGGDKDHCDHHWDSTIDVFSLNTTVPRWLELQDQVSGRQRASWQV